MSADDWPQWRGPNRDGVWHEQGVLKAFPTDGLKIRWRQPVGLGLSSPIVAQGRVFLTDVQLGKPMSKERVLCFDAESGKPLWNFPYDTQYSEPGPDGFLQGPIPTPIWRNGKLYAIGKTELHCLDAASETLVWKTSLDKVTDSTSGSSAHITTNGDRAFLFTDRGELILANLSGKEYKEISRAPLIEPTFPYDGRHFAWTPPAYANKCIFARSDKELVCASLAE